MTDRRFQTMIAWAGYIFVFAVLIGILWWMFKSP